MAGKPKHLTTSAIQTAAAAITASVLVLAMPAYADQQAGTAPAAAPVKTPKRITHRYYAPTKQRPGYGAAPNASGCTSYNNMFPPCQSTWPQGSPQYHGPVPGVTFDD
jgi:hypothetical protein